MRPRPGLRALVARLSLALLIGASAGGCCRCFWPGASGGTGAAGPAASGGPPAAISPPPTGSPPSAMLALDAFDPDPTSPLHGAILHQDGATKFVVPKAISAAPVGNGALLVHANTGLWLHDGATLARRDRVLPPPIDAMAASPDGALVATITGRTLKIMKLEGMAVQATVPGVDPPYRLRFSPDGRSVVIGSRSKETVTLVDIATRRVHQYDTDDDVNDAIALPDGDHVAYANDGDEAGVVSMKSGKKTFSSKPLLREAQNWNRGFPVPSFIMRDQNAVAYDPNAKMLLAGGDDNVVWRFVDIDAPKPRPDKPFEFNGNVEEILVAPDSSIVVALDTLAVHTVRPDGTFTSSLGPLLWSVESRSIRIALTPSNEVATVLQGSLALFRPSDASVIRSQDYPQLVGWTISAGGSDTVIVAPTNRAPMGAGQYVVQRVAHGAPAADVGASILGTVDLAGQPFVFPLPSAQAIVGFTPSPSLRVAFVSSAGALEAPIDTPAEGPGSIAIRGDHKAIGLLDETGKLFEITDAPRAVSKVGQGPAPHGGLRLEWDDARRTWVEKGNDGSTSPIATTAP